MSKRTDIHRPGALIPAHYECWLDYSMASSESGFPVPPIGVDCAWPRTTYGSAGQVVGVSTPTCPDTGRCCARSAERAARAAGKAIFGACGRCGVCGAHYVYGSLFRHENGELVHMGHDCASKYELMQDLSAWELENKRTRTALATAIAREQNREAREAILAQHPGLAEALELGSTNDGSSKAQQIIADIAARFVRFVSISDKQAALVLKLADEIQNPRPEIVEVNCPAPEGKGVQFEGVIVSAKVTDSDFGLAYKMTVKVTRDDGAVWLAYGTCPASIAGTVQQLSDLRGRRVVVKASLVRGRDTHFAFMNRPSASFSDLYDHPVYEVPKCVLGQPCRIVQHAVPGPAGTWAPIICDGRCKNVAKPARKPRAKKTAAAVGG